MMHNLGERKTTVIFTFSNYYMQHYLELFLLLISVWYTQRNLFRFLLNYHLLIPSIQFLQKC